MSSKRSGLRLANPLASSAPVMRSVQAWQRGDAVLHARFERFRELARRSRGCQECLTCDSPDYPTCFREIADPPSVLDLRAGPAARMIRSWPLVGYPPTPARMAPPPPELCPQLHRGRAFFAGDQRDGSGHDERLVNQGALDAEGKPLAVWGTWTGQLAPGRHKAPGAARLFETG